MRWSVAGGRPQRRPPDLHGLASSLGQRDEVGVPESTRPVLPWPWIDLGSRVGFASLDAIGTRHPMCGSAGPHASVLPQRCPLTYGGGGVNQWFVAPSRIIELISLMGMP
jgi:hypothetical protein